MDKKTVEAKLRRSLQVLLYLFEVKTGIKVDSAKNINFTYWSADRNDSTLSNGSIYYELDLVGSVDDPDPSSLSYEIKRISDLVYNFFSSQVLDYDTLSFVNGDPSDSDDLIGLLFKVDFNWSGGEGNNLKIRFSFENNFYGQEITF